MKTIFAPNYPSRTSTMDGYTEAAKAKKFDPFFDEKWDYLKENKLRAKSFKPNKIERLVKGLE